MMRASDIFRAIGNTGAAAYCRNTCLNLVRTLPSTLDQTAMHREVVPYSTVVSFLQLRHPDKAINRHLQVTENDLQMRGSWQKVDIRKRLNSRMAHAGFIWKSACIIPSNRPQLH